jgi:cytochrome c-type biogenesis protein CcmE
MAIICDDPDTVFKVVMCSATTVIASASTAMIGQNFGLIQNAGSANTGNSAVAALYAASTTGADLALRVVGLVEETAIQTSATGSSSSTTITLTGSGLPSALVVGTDVSYVAANGQLVQTGSFMSVAAAATATTVTINAAIAVPGSVTAIPSASTIIFTQYPEMKVKLNFGTHSYYTATAV